MPSTKCFCGVEIAGDDRDAQAAAGVAHFNEAHAEIGVTLQGMRNFLEREEMLTGPTDRLEALGEVQIVDLSADRVDDVLAFFDHDAFADNPGWAACYCMAHHVDEEEWGTRSWQTNRDDLAARVRAGATTGTLAYVDGKLAGWCNASARSEFPHYAKDKPDEQVGVVACFVMSPPYRGHGLARRLLDAAVEQFRRRGMTAVEGYCANEADNPQVAYRGTVPLYESAGFASVHRGNRTTVMRKEL